ncbi:MAG TPA: glycerol-3-phosphate 1-O-acyltransferase PlsY [Candidatus Limiplasma sp.]|nr:glycerol-3-phosphate 1-O-acyltransferase PlsY [Candidatus Limiplasma sp.]HRX08785.1 glycerol-3-phosphate 1-O-acyltransferase PlsY [Candidatus Limiplasma sp.]
MNDILLTAAVALAGYLLGCFSTGILISNQAGVNIREAGSKNTGASNVLRVLGIGRGAITFLGDALKAVLACWIGGLLLPGTTFGIERFGVMVGGLGAILGHNWPVFFSFKGGKGIASSTAVLLFVDPLLGGISIALCIIVIAVTRYISVGSIVMLLTFLVLTCIFHLDQWFACIFAAVLFLLGVYRHRSNIQRLREGTENKIGRKKTAQ